ncbi:hypothetical protein FRB99_007430 [Tulasnella sp. 403]|nr:hypothetical protein FRB99_007430 [Tulasnella sp. 403]
MASDKENSRGARVSLPVNPSQWDELTPRKKARRSLAPRKSILKFYNGNDDTTAPLPIRRVSFVERAAVKLYDREARLIYSPQEDASASRPSLSRSRRSSAGRRSSGIGGNLQRDSDEEGSSMEIENDAIVPNAQLYIPHNPQGEDSFDDSLRDDNQQTDEDDMDMTTGFKSNIFVSAAARRASIVPNILEEEVVAASVDTSLRSEGSEQMEFTVPLGQPIQPSKRTSLANEAWARLQALEPNSESNAPDDSMDMQQPPERLFANGVAGVRGPDVGPLDTAAEDSMDMSMDSYRASFMRDDQTMDLASVVQPEFSFHEERQEELSGLDQPVLDNPFLLPAPTSSQDDDPSAHLISLGAFDFSVQPFGVDHDAESNLQPLKLPPLNLSTFPLPDVPTSLPTSSAQHTSHVSPESLSKVGASPSDSLPLPTFASTSSSNSLASSAPPVIKPKPTRIPSPVKKSQRPAPDTTPQSKTKTPATAPQPSTPSRRQALPRSTPSKSTPSRRTPTRPKTPTRTPPATKSTPTRKRPADPTEPTSASKRIAVGEDSQSQRAVSVEPSQLVVSELLTDGEVIDATREASAPPDLQIAPSTSRRSSFALRRAKRNSLAGTGGNTAGVSVPTSLPSIQEMRESLATSVGGPLIEDQEDPAEDTEPVQPAIAEEVEHVEEAGAGGADENDENEAPADDDEEEHTAHPVVDDENTGRAVVSPEDNRSFGDRPRVSVAEFLDMVGIQFHENMPIQRRQTLGVDMMMLEDGTLGPIPPEDHEFSLSDYYRAEAVDLPQLDCYQWVTSELKRQMSDLKEQLGVLEEEIEENPPPSVLDFLEADNEVRPRVEAIFKQAKAFSKRTARGEWYRWRARWTKDLQPHVDKETQTLETHLDFVREQRDKLRRPLEELRQLQASLKQDLERERASVAEIEACDPEQLEGLKAGISEQNLAIEGYKADIAQVTSELERYKGQVEERETECQVAQDTIVASKKRGEVLGTTKEDVLKRKAAFESLQELHGWKLKHISPTLLELTHLVLRLDVRIPLESFHPLCDEVTIRPTDPEGAQDPRLQPFPSFLDAFVTSGERSIRESGFTSARAIVRHLDVLWGSYSLVLTELRMLWIKHPLKVTVAKDGSVVVLVTIVFRPKSRPDLKSKALVQFTFTREVLSQWPKNIAALGVDVQIPYGSVEPDTVKEIIRDRLKVSTGDQHYCSLFDACGEAVAKYQ